jgi:hypothetical protein
MRKGNENLNEKKTGNSSIGCVRYGVISVCLLLLQNHTLTEVLCCSLPELFNIFFSSCPFQY